MSNYAQMQNEEQQRIKKGASEREKMKTKRKKKKNIKSR
jgi:hypothetical protein